MGISLTWEWARLEWAHGGSSYGSRSRRTQKPSTPRGTGALLAALVATVVFQGCNAAEPLPPIILITLDTTRPDHLSTYGYSLPTSPHLETLARDGFIVRNFVTTSSWTLPTHASLFTGLFPSTHGAHYSNSGNLSLLDATEGEDKHGNFRANRLPDEAITLAEVLSSVGYRTYGAAAGPWLKPIFGMAQGFDQYDADFDSSPGR